MHIYRFSWSSNENISYYLQFLLNAEWPVNMVIAIDKTRNMDECTAAAYYDDDYY